ncbi:hypothetical protein Xbed_03490 [Xenorhabdus beddingii]|uniref:Uncharacterized protein n=1 Tax=Xenorhabdus beddingii TaxID=40578 RepID=A0A1Y2SFI1_9GAMM|nr:hypothetical protein Xbed_03490 [Xenorhabdus beddingii]
MLCELPAQFSRNQFNASLRLQIRHQTFLTRRVCLIFTGQYYGFAHTVTLPQSCLDFARFDAEATQFDLKIIAPKVFNIAVGQPTTEVAGFVHPRIRLRGERIGEETFCGQFGAIQVTPGNAGTGNVNFADHSEGNRLTARIENIDPGIGNRTTDGNSAGHINGGGNRISCGKRGGFRRAIAIDQVCGL